MAESAKMRCPFASLRINPEAASSLAFQQIMGLQRAAWFLYSAETLSAQEAKATGIALDVFPDEGFQRPYSRRPRSWPGRRPTPCRKPRLL